MLYNRDGKGRVRRRWGWSWEEDELGDCRVGSEGWEVRRPTVGEK